MQSRNQSPRWQAFLSSSRVGNVAKSSPGNRRPFQIDYDAIVWSDPFRRLVDKTQVFPLPDNDHIHNRLTHSLEVSSIGRTVGAKIGARLAEAGVCSAEEAADIPDIVGAACLAHDIGNPPFGHFGEASISAWVAERQVRLTDAGVDSETQSELAHFEGNALGFRILVRHQQPESGGLRLTLATLAAGAKYPCSHARGCQAGPTHLKKFGFLRSDREIFREVATGTGMVADGEDAWRRHPLAWLVEAADDITNTLVDLEDGFRAAAISYEEAREALHHIANRQPNFSTNESRYRGYGPGGHIAAMRSIAIGVLSEDVCNTFMENRAAIDDGTHDLELIKGSPSIDHIKSSIRPVIASRCFDHPTVLQTELAGKRILTHLLDELFGALIEDPDSSASARIRKLTRLEFSSMATTPSLKLVEVLEFVSGMTDGFALRLYRGLLGIELPR